TLFVIAPVVLRSSTAAAAHVDATIVTAFVTDDADAAVLSFTAALSVPRFPNSCAFRRLPVFAVIVAELLLLNPATTKLFASCVVRLIVWFAVAPKFTAVAPIAWTPADC